MNEPAKVAKPDTIRHLGAVPIAGLKALISSISDHVWSIEDERKENNFAVFHDTRHIILRFIPGNLDHRQFYSTPAWEALKGHVLPVMDTVTAVYGFASRVYPKVMLARLGAGATIDRHSDGGGSNLYTHKIHVPIVTNERVAVIIEGQPFHLEEGHAYELNNIARHSVDNHGATDRIHLVFEVFDDPATLEAKA